MDLAYLPLTLAEIPVAKDYDIGNVYTFRFQRNVKRDFLTCEVLNSSGAVIYATRLTYLASLIHAEVDGLEFTKNLIPFDINELSASELLHEYLTSENFDEVQLFEQPV
jgi:hypothetical protein